MTRLLRTAAAVAVAFALAACASDGDQPQAGPAPAPISTASPAASALASPAPVALGPMTLEVSTVPSGADVRVVGGDGAAVSGTAPYEATVAGGQVVVEVTRPGFNDVTRPMELTENGEVTVWLDRRGQLLTSQARWATGSQPKQVAFTPDGAEVWTSLLGGTGVQIYDADTGEQDGNVTLGQHGAVEVIFTRDGATAYASQMETASVYEIDTASREVRRRIDGEGNWSKVMALSPDERTLYLANWISNDVSEIDLDAGEVRQRIPTVRTPRGLYVTPDGGKLYVAGYDDGEIQVIDLRSGEKEILIRTGGAMRHLVGDATGERLYASDMATSTVHVIDLRTDEVQDLATVDANPNTIDLSPDGRVLFVSCRGRNGADYLRPGPEWGSVVLVDAASGELLDAIVGGNQTTGLDLSGDGRRLAFSDFLDNRISVYEVPGYDVLLAGDGGRVAEHEAELAKGGS